jgi:hypothetical protein
MGVGAAVGSSLRREDVLFDRAASGRAAQVGRDDAEARDYFSGLLSVVSEGNDRPEIRTANASVDTR